MVRSVKDLYYPRQESFISFDWSADHEDGEPGYVFWEGVRVGGKTFVFSTETGTWSDHYVGGVLRSEEPDFDLPDELSYLGDTVEGPLMSGYWPLGEWLGDNDERYLAARLSGLPVCLVKVDDIYGLALTGGGMDLSWDLATAAIECGFYPWLDLVIHQGSPDSTWKYGVGQVGAAAARRVRAALRHRFVTERRLLLNRLSDLKSWGK